MGVDGDRNGEADSDSANGKLLYLTITILSAAINAIIPIFMITLVVRVVTAWVGSFN